MIELHIQKNALLSLVYTNLYRFLGILALIFSFLQLYAQNANISNGFIFDGEPYLAVDPLNNEHLVVAWMSWDSGLKLAIDTKVSYNGGNSWSNSSYVDHIYDSYTSADPCVQFDGNNDPILSYIDFKPTRDSGAVYIRKSMDGGETWGSAIEVMNVEQDPSKLPIDRPWMSIDANDNHIYVTSMNAAGALGPPFNPYYVYL